MTHLHFSNYYFLGKARVCLLRFRYCSNIRKISVEASLIILSQPIHANSVWHLILPTTSCKFVFQCSVFHLFIVITYNIRRNPLWEEILEPSKYLTTDHLYDVIQNAFNCRWTSWKCTVKVVLWQTHCNVPLSHQMVQSKRLIDEGFMTKCSQTHVWYRCRINESNSSFINPVFV